MRANRLPILFAGLAALAIVLAGCSGNHAPTLPTPDVGGNANSRFSLELTGQGGPITGATLGQFTVQERACGSADAFRPAQPTQLIETVGEEINQANVVLNLDRSGSMSGEMGALKDAAKLFVSLMRAVDLTQIMSFNSSWGVDQTFTSDQGLLNAAIDGISAGGGTNAWDSGAQGIADLVALAAPGIKALVIMSDGASSGDLQGLIDAANAASIPIYTIALGLTPGSQAEADMRRAADDTGGQFFAPATAQQLEDAFFQVSQALQGRYQIFWNSTFDAGTFVEVRITYNGPGGPIVIEPPGCIEIKDDE